MGIWCLKYYGNRIETFTDQIWRKLFDIGFPYKFCISRCICTSFKMAEKLNRELGLLRAIYYLVPHLVHETSTKIFRIRAKLAKTEFCVKFLYKMVYAVFGGKIIWREALLNFCLKSCQGKRCANFFKVSRQKT